MARTDILNVITPDQAVMVLKELAAIDPEIRKKARAIARKLVSDVDVEEIAEEVFWELDSIAHVLRKASDGSIRHALVSCPTYSRIVSACPAVGRSVE